MLRSFIPVQLNTLSTVSIFDTGSAFTIVSKRIELLNLPMSISSVREGVTNNGKRIKLRGRISPTLTTGGKSNQINSFVVDDNEYTADFFRVNYSITKLVLM